MLKLERIYTKPFDIDGYRIFVDRMWCRGISKKNAKLNQWTRNIAPSTNLRKWFKHEDAKYSEFKERYLNELKQNNNTQAFVKLIKKHLQNGNVIILYGAKNTIHNNAVVIRDYLNQKLNLNLHPNHSFIHFLYNDGETNLNKKLNTDVKWLNQHKLIMNKFNLQIKGADKIYHGTNKKALDHQELMEIISGK